MQRKILSPIGIGLVLYSCTSTNAIAPFKEEPEITFKPVIIETTSKYPRMTLHEERIVISTPVAPSPTPKTKKPALKPKILSSINPKDYAKSLVGSVQFVCLDKLWTKESNWNHLSYNKSSGAYGIPQAVPGSKMASAGTDWRTNPLTQIKWGIGYIKGRYETPCNAWNFWWRNHWY